MKTNIKQIDRNACRVLHAAAKDAIEKAIAEQFEGVQVVLTPGSFCPSSFTFKVEIATANGDGTVNHKDAEAFRLLASMYGLQPDDLGKEFTFRGQRYKITGCKPKSNRFPIMAERVSDGKSFKFPADAVKAGLVKA